MANVSPLFLSTAQTDKLRRKRLKHQRWMEKGPDTDT